MSTNKSSTPSCPNTSSQEPPLASMSSYESPVRISDCSLYLNSLDNTFNHVITYVSATVITLILWCSLFSIARNFLIFLLATDYDRIWTKRIFLHMVLLRWYKMKRYKILIEDSSMNICWFYSAHTTSSYAMIDEFSPRIMYPARNAS